MMEDPLSISSERSFTSSPRRDSALSAMSAWELAEHCKQEMSHYRRGDPSNDQYAVELFRRAPSHGDQEAWAEVQHCFGESVRGWLRQHPNREAACHLDNEEHYVALAFERFWQATTSQKLEFGQLSAVLLYLRAHLNGVVLDTLRTSARLRKVTLPEPHEEDQIASLQGWSDVQEIYRLRRNILERVLNNANKLRWQVNHGEQV